VDRSGAGSRRTARGRAPESSTLGNARFSEQNPFAGLTHVSALLYCMQDYLAAGGHGETPSDGLGWVEAAFDAAGFETTSFGSETGYRVFVGTKPVTS
jgi:hypothetical protein